ncbi:alpha-galactosidase [Micromonospora sp. CPCC 205556]|uniref:alpha-galactosidase n=1 Tax=Micromonospora sp. CPCC 205556 TaxID=3122398 RepID=UPI002FF130D7
MSGEQTGVVLSISIVLAPAHNCTATVTVAVMSQPPLGGDVWPDGLGPFVEVVRSHGMQFGRWFEPEMINLDSELAQRHPDSSRRTRPSTPSATPPASPPTASTRPRDARGPVVGTRDRPVDGGAPAFR